MEHPITFETAEEFYNARWRQSYNEGMNELIMDPSMQPERRIANKCHNDCDCHNVEKIADMVNHPPHYNSRSMEVIDIIEMCIEPEENPKVAYNMSNALKYILRFRGKNGKQDIEKAIWYLNRMMKKLDEE